MCVCLCVTIKWKRTGLTLSINLDESSNFQYNFESIDFRRYLDERGYKFRVKDCLTNKRGSVHCVYMLLFTIVLFPCLCWVWCDSSGGWALRDTLTLHDTAQWLCDHSASHSVLLFLCSCHPPLQACLLLLATCSVAMLMWPVNQRSSQLISPHTGRDSTHPAYTWAAYMDNTCTESEHEGHRRHQSTRQRRDLITHCHVSAHDRTSNKSIHTRGLLNELTLLTKKKHVQSEPDKLECARRALVQNPLKWTTSCTIVTCVYFQEGGAWSSKGRCDGGGGVYKSFSSSRNFSKNIYCRSSKLTVCLFGVWGQHAVSKTSISTS